MHDLQTISLRSLALFVAVVDSGSFSEVARREGVAASTISRMVQQMEATLGSQLLFRNTRNVSPTEAGMQFAGAARTMLAQFNTAQAQLIDQQQQPAGMVRINAPVSFGQRHLAPWLGELLLRHPALKVELMQTDDFIDPLQEGTDLLLRIGELKDSRCHARVLAHEHYMLVASPSYLQRCGFPTTPDDLLRHQCLLYRGVHGLQRWYFRDERGQWQNPLVAGALVANNAETLIIAAENGLGLVLFPDWLVGDRLHQGKLVRVLPGCEAATKTAPQAISLIWPRAHQLPLKTRAVIDFFVEKFGQPAYWTR